MLGKNGRRPDLERPPARRCLISGGERVRHESVEALGIRRCAVGDRLERFASKFHASHFVSLEVSVHGAVKRTLGQSRPEAEIFGRRLRFGERADRVRRLLENLHGPNWTAILTDGTRRPATAIRLALDDGLDIARERDRRILRRSCGFS